MPYITSEDRAEIDHAVDALIEKLKSVPSGKVGGAVNYAICRLVCGSLKPAAGWSYSSLSEAIGHAYSACCELRRRLLDPYEDQAALKNGDLKEFSE